MAKYYVQSGDFQYLVQADSAREAALWAMHLAMETIVPLDDLDSVLALCDDLILCDDLVQRDGLVQRDDLQLTDRTTKLGHEMSLSEIGFGRSEAGCFGTMDVMTEWNQLTLVVARLSECLEDDAR